MTKAKILPFQTKEQRELVKTINTNNADDIAKGLKKMFTDKELEDMRKEFAEEEEGPSEVTE